MRLQAVLIPVVLEISSMSLSSEASRVSFLNQTLLQIEKYIKNGQPSFQCNAKICFNFSRTEVAALYHLFEKFYDCET